MYSDVVDPSAFLEKRSITAAAPKRCDGRRQVAFARAKPPPSSRGYFQPDATKNRRGMVFRKHSSSENFREWVRYEKFDEPGLWCMRGTIEGTKRFGSDLDVQI